MREENEMHNNWIAGADIGGTHITVAIIDSKSKKRMGDTHRIKVDAKKDANAILNKWALVIQEGFAAVHAKPSKVGIAMPGPFDYETGISYIKGQGKFDTLYGLNVKEALAYKLSIAGEDILFANDAECYLKGEVLAGAGSGVERVIGLTLGTGLGSAFHLNSDTNDAALWCSPFKDGIAEDYLSTRWFLRRYEELSGQTVEDVKELASRWKEDSRVPVVFNEFGANLAGFLQPFIEKNDLQLVILGGNIAQAYPFFDKALKQGLAGREATTQIRTAQLGEEAALIGAAGCHFLFEAAS